MQQNAKYLRNLPYVGFQVFQSPLGFRFEQRGESIRCRRNLISGDRDYEVGGGLRNLWVALRGRSLAA